MQLNNEVSNNWELWCVGVLGHYIKIELFIQRLNILDFFNPSEIEHLIKNTSVFILPSHFEPWGVAVHEFSSAGFPLILRQSIFNKNLFLIIM